MASSSITLWQIGGEAMETVTNFISLGSKITADDDCSHKIKTCLLLGRKAMTSIDSILKSRVLTFLTKVHLVKAIVFPVVMYGCEIWTIKKAEHWRIDAFKLWCWRRLLRVPWTARRSNHSILKEINLEYHWKDWCWSWSSNTSATWCKEPTHSKRPWFWEDRKQEKGMTENEMVGWHHWLNGHEFEQTPGGSEGQGSLVCCSPWGGKELDAIELLNNNKCRITNMGAFWCASYW